MGSSKKTKQNKSVLISRCFQLSRRSICNLKMVGFWQRDRGNLWRAIICTPQGDFRRVMVYVRSHSHASNAKAWPQDFEGTWVMNITWSKMEATHYRMVWRIWFFRLENITLEKKNLFVANKITGNFGYLTYIKFNSFIILDLNYIGTQGNLGDVDESVNFVVIWLSFPHGHFHIPQNGYS